MSDTEYSEGICGDGAAILKNGKPMKIGEIVNELRRLRDELAKYKEIAKYAKYFLDDIDNGGSNIAITEAFLREALQGAEDE